MSSRYTALILVMLCAAVVFALGKSVFTRFMSAEDFARRRNVWLALVAASFLAPNIWLYVLVAVPLLIHAGKKDSNPVALYLALLLAVPPARIQIPTFGLIGQIFPLDHLRLLSLALLLPIAIRMAGTRDAPYQAGAGSTSKRWTAIDFFVVAYLALQVALMLPYESMTSVVRRILLLCIDVALPYFVLSRACRTPAMIAESMAAFVMSTVVLVPLAVYEFFKGWMLFAGIQDAWGAGRMYFPLYRGSFLRAQTTAGHSINFGYFMAVAFGMWLYLQSHITSKMWRWLGMAGVLAGLVVALARGPWVAAVAVLFCFLSLGPNAASRLLKGSAVVAVFAGLVLASPWQSQVIDYLPFIGTVDEHTIIQRQQLAAGSWLLILQNPIFGSPYFMAYMEEFRTGEGIIDLVNTYATVALSFGFVGAGLFVAIFLSALWKAYRVVRRHANTDPDFSLLGAALIACIVGTLLVIATTSFQLALPSVAWALVALTWAYVRSAEATYRAYSGVDVGIDGGRPLATGTLWRT